MTNGMLSVILLSYKSGKRLIGVREKLDEELSRQLIPYELIIIDDGSADGSFEIALALERKFANVRAFELSRNFTSHYAIFAGLKVSKGDCATVIADDEQQPYSLIPAMYREWQNKASIIFPYRSKRNDPWITRTAARVFYKVMNLLSDFDYHPNGIDAFFIDREIIDMLNDRISPRNTTIVTELLRLGFSPKYLPHIREKSTVSKSRWTFRKKIKLAMDWFFSTSSFPIKLITFLGITISFCAFCLIIFYLYAKISGRIEVKGWVSLVILISFFSGLTLLSLGIIAEYIWRIYEEVKSRPGFIIRQKQNDH